MFRADGVLFKPIIKGSEYIIIIIDEGRGAKADEGR